MLIVDRKLIVSLKAMPHRATGRDTHQSSAVPVAKMGGSGLLQRQIGNRAAQQLIQRQLTGGRDSKLIQREFDDESDSGSEDERGELLAEDKKVEDEYRSFGLDLIEAYRLMDQFSDAMAAKKNTSAAKTLTLSLVSLSVTIAAKFAALPDIPTGAAGFSMPDASDLLSAPDAGEIAGMAASGAEGMGAGPDTAGSGVTHGTTTYKGQMKAAVKKRFGSKGAAARTVVGLVIPVDTLLAAGKAVMQLAESKDDWNRGKGRLAAAIEQTMMTMDQVCHRIDEAGMQDIAVSATKRKLSFMTSTRTLADVVAKYEDKRDKLQDIIGKWDAKHGEARPLMSGSASSDADDADDDS